VCLERGPFSLVRITEKLLWCRQLRFAVVGTPRGHHATPTYIFNICTNFAYHRKPLSRYRGFSSNFRAEEWAKKTSSMKQVEEARSSETSVTFIEIRGCISQQTVLLSSTAARTSYVPAFSVCVYGFSGLVRPRLPASRHGRQRLGTAPNCDGPSPLRL
jgi:hypothetical protein